MSSIPQQPETTSVEGDSQLETAEGGGKNRRWLKIGGIGCAGVLGLCVLLGVVLVAAGVGTDDDEDDEVALSTVTRAEEDPTLTMPPDDDPTASPDEDRASTSTAESDSSASDDAPTATPLSPTATETQAPTATPEPSPTPTPSAFTFGDGVKRVGDDIPPGIYHSIGPGGGLFDSCYWERLAGFSGELDDIIANEFADYRQVVEIKETDAGFNSEGCGGWTEDLSPITENPTAPFGDGVWIVGVDIASGTWQSETPPDGSCYWERMSGFGGELDDIISNEFTESQQVVTIQPSDVGFNSSGCGAWTLVSQ